MHHPYVNIAIEAGLSASRAILQHFDHLDRLKMTEKSQHDFVSEADLHAEKIIIKTIKTAYPDHGIIAEESTPQESTHDCRWIIDPIDGTFNFVHGIPHFCISIAVEIKGKIEHGVIIDPLRQEIFSATRGRGAYLNNKRIRVSPQGLLSNSVVATNIPHARRQTETYQEYLRIFNAFLPVCARIRHMGSAALDLAYVAAGRLDGYWARGLNYWDIAAGSLLVFEAGGLLSDFNGGENYLAHGNIVATTPKILKGLLQTFASAAK
ncbi:MAG: inositol monophosphatase [Gammaproteobacteria bacterium]|nr:inositol monophosphatase [Gammaproteobacteria bacterium]MCD8542386.1 inositol monophosphatase [Gammaproteobacteria bacterium]MCD8573661.1 inositol monophosphatase [Gammaproteobacteria bacterium]